ncbi:ethanolamine ammonia-lyase [Methylocystis sp. WRRC1]|uniref:ethanolamine ammonia-lyase n=1 Tax=Methylocystis sp. WRRC1 TaxID=1732014 RepID=UPI001D158364|nr:ethanolamine ammonia-lyase [Methylocystis sp. WRRC1]MCC3246255.1 ethanolamine ammonia-lyase [Methylocystis sp. WRRC1]
MIALKPLSEIHVPTPMPDEAYEIGLFDRSFRFVGLKALLGAADFDKAGDRLAALAAQNDVEREAARKILSNLKLRHLYDRPLTDGQGRVDQVMRVNYDIDLDVFAEFADLTVGEAKDFILRNKAPAIKRLGTALTGVMAAAIAKLMDVHELVYSAKKLKRSATARTTVGLPGTLSSRLQPNHPTDDLSAVTLLVYTGLSLGAGDALIGLNPAIDTVDNAAAILNHLDKLRRQTGAPTQICVLAHIKTQLACLERGDPVEIMFQSLAGTDRTLIEEFDCTVDLLDRAYRVMLERRPIGDDAKQFMYFETGQGSEVSYGKHNGADMTTTEALCYGLARRYDPFMVNNVTGFIGPETHRTNVEMILSNLQDHFIGKLLGIPMGMAPCYTLHSEVTMEGQQIAAQLLSAAGANYFMDVYLGVDRMLAYFDTSSHDDQTMRETYGLEPAPEFAAWAMELGIFQRDAEGALERGPNWGNPRIFCDSDMELQRLRENLPAAYGWENAGPRPANAVSRDIKANIAAAREAIYTDISAEKLGSFDFRRISTKAGSKADHLNNPDLGARLDGQLRARLQPEEFDVQIVISDGLSAEAIHHNIAELLPVLMDGLAQQQITVGTPILAPYGRVKLAEEIGNSLKSKLVIILIGERPGGDAMAARSMSAYLAYRLEDDEVRNVARASSGHGDIRYEYTVISNIYRQGLPPVEAGGLIAERAGQILHHRAAGNRLERVLGEAVGT